MSRLYPSRWRVFDRALVVVLAALFALFGYATVDARHKSDRLAREGAQAKAALCSFRADLQQRIRNSEDFLIEHPGDLDLGALHIPRAQLLNTLNNQKATLASLDDLHCKGAA